MVNISKKQFEYNLYHLKQEQVIYGYDTIDIPYVYEYVYSIKTRLKCLSILIYTSIDKQTNKTRPYGSDRIRLVYQWKTKNGILYSKIKHINRVGKIFDRLSSILSNVINTEFNPRNWHWVNENEFET